MVPDARWEDLDPLEFERFRRMIRESRGRSDAALAELPDQEIAKALGAVEELLSRLQARNREEELMVNIFRLGIPDYSGRLSGRRPAG